MPPLPTPSDEAVRELATRILERPEYASWRHPYRLEPFLDWLGTLWIHHPVLYWTLLAGLVLVAALLLGHVAWALRTALAASAPGTAGSAPLAEPRFADEAEALARRGRFLEAARYLQLAVLQLLLHARVLELARSDANPVLKRRLDAAPLAETERRDLLVLIDRLERSWFRDRREDPQLYAAWRTLHARLGAGLTAA